MLQLGGDAVETVNERERKEGRWLISRRSPVSETFVKDAGVPGAQPDAVDVLIVELRAAVRDEVYQTDEQRLCGGGLVQEKGISRAVQLFKCGSAEGCKILMRAVQDRVHLVIWLSTVGARECCSSFSWILESFGTIAAVPAFVQTVPQDGCAESFVLVAKQSPAASSVS